MLLQPSLIDHIRQSTESLKKAERRVASTILDNIEAATRMSIKELAASASVSEPTVLRFARRMGCDGYAEFKIRISQDNAIARMFVLTEEETLSGDAPTVAAAVYDAAAQTLAHSFAQCDPIALEAATSAIVDAKRLFCFGLGGSSANIAIEAENRLFRYDIPAVAIIDSYRQRLAVALCECGDVVLAFSVTGKPAALVESANAARGLGATVISVTRRETPLAEESSIVVPLEIVDHEKHLQIPSRTRYGQLFILDCIAAMVGTRRLASSAPKLRRARAALLSVNGPTEQQPIGD